MQTKRRRQKEFWSIIFCWAACVKLSALSDRENYKCDPFAIVWWRFFVPIEFISQSKEVQRCLRQWQFLSIFQFIHPMILPTSLFSFIFSHHFLRVSSLMRLGDANKAEAKRILIDRSFCWSVCVKLSALWDRESYNCDPFAIVSWRFFVPIEYISHFKEVGAFTIAKWKQRIISNEKMNLILNFLVRFPPKCWMLKPLIITSDCHSIATLSHFSPCSFFQLRDSH